MTLQEFGLREGNYFVAMEYYGLILNRTFLVLITKDHLIGLKVNGMVSVDIISTDLLTAKITEKMVIKDDLENPSSYVKVKYLEKLIKFSVLSEEILKVHRANFKIARSEINSVTYDKRKKWGMGYYPHDGKVYVRTINNQKKEFIILGAQSGEKIKEWIENK